MCNLCDRVMCTNHFTLPADTDTEALIFVCVACHIRAFPKPSPYFLSSYCHFISFFHFHFILFVSVPFRRFLMFCKKKGFYKSMKTKSDATSWNPAFKTALEIKGDYQLAASSQIISMPLLLLHFIVNGVSPDGNPAGLISNILTGYLKDFLYEEIVFDFSTNKLALKYTKRMTNFIESIERWIDITVLTVLLDLMILLDMASSAS